VPKRFDPKTPAVSVRDRRSAIRSCVACPRLGDWMAEQRRRHPEHHNAPVPDRGDPGARLLFVGLAPGRLGANRTGQVFVGDSSSEFLFNALHAAGLASSAEPEKARLLGARLTNVVKCLPPLNQPQRVEVQNCSRHLRAELAQFWTPHVKKPRVLLSLGGLAHRALWQSLPDELTAGSACPKFGHGASTQLSKNLWLVSCFHPSKLNTQTGRLTQSMLRSVLNQAAGYLDLKPS